MKFDSRPSIYKAFQAPKVEDLALKLTADAYKSPMLSPDKFKSKPTTPKLMMDHIMMSGAPKVPESSSSEEYDDEDDNEDGSEFMASNAGRSVISDDIAAKSYKTFKTHKTAKSKKNKVKK